MLKRLVFVLTLVSLLACATGCATLRSGKQRLKLASEPEGLEVLDNGAVIGVTPAFVEVERARQTSLEFRDVKGKSVTVPLRGKYRWGDSFISDFILLIGAPVGWAIDFISGHAWEYKNPPLVELGTAPPARERAFVPRRDSLIAVAPPHESYELLSDELGTKLAARLRKRYPNVDVIPYEKTYPTFNVYSYSNSRPTPPYARNDLYYRLGARYVAESETVRGQNAVIVNSEIKDCFTDQVVDKFETTVANSELESTKKSGVSHALLSLVSIVPNSVGLDFTVPQFAFQDAQGNTMPASAAVESPVTRYLSAIALRSVHSPSLFSKMKFTFRFIPSVWFSYRELSFQEPGPIGGLDGAQFSWYTLAAGEGVELGLETALGFFYTQLVPMYGLSIINAQSPNGSYSNTAGEFSVELEAGLLVFVSKQVFVRLFARYLDVTGNQWNDTISWATGTPTTIGQSAYGLAGISLGYYFPEARTDVKDWVK